MSKVINKIKNLSYILNPNLKNIDNHYFYIILKNSHFFLKK